MIIPILQLRQRRIDDLHKAVPGWDCSWASQAQTVSKSCCPEGLWALEAAVNEKLCWGAASSWVP